MGTVDMLKETAADWDEQHIKRDSHVQYKQTSDSSWNISAS
jgi:hypothetical protein